MASKDPRPSKADAKLDPRPKKADADVDPRPTNKPDAQGVDTTPDTDQEPAPRAIADSLPPPDASGPGEQKHLDPSQRATASNGGH